MIPFLSLKDVTALHCDEINAAVIRDGFEQFMNYVRKNEIPFHIVSGGIDF